jgi:hypothetical protein
MCHRRTRRVGKLMTILSRLRSPCFMLLSATAACRRTRAGALVALRRFASN